MFYDPLGQKTDIYIIQIYDLLGQIQWAQHKTTLKNIVSISSNFLLTSQREKSSAFFVAENQLTSTAFKARWDGMEMEVWWSAIGFKKKGTVIMMCVTEQCFLIGRRMFSFALWMTNTATSLSHLQTTCLWLSMKQNPANSDGALESLTLGRKSPTQDRLTHQSRHRRLN